MSNTKPTRIDLMLAGACRNCPVCQRARQQKRGLAFRLVQKVETKLCPFCRAYERVHGRKAHVAAVGHQSSAQTTTPPSP